MRAVAQKKPSEDHKRRSNIANHHTDKKPLFSSPFLSNDNIIIQLNPICPCDGGCPRCQPIYPIQTKLIIGQPDDKYEKEADRVADQVIGMPESAFPECADVYKVQTKPSPGHSQQQGTVSQAKLHAVSCPGQSLTASTRSFFEPRLGRDFNDVRVHTCSDAVKMCKDLNAQAFTYGSTIYFNKGKYAPGTSSGNSLLAHELTHVVQQSNTLSIQRSPLTEEEKQEDLQSEKYAGNHRLQKAYDNNPPMRVGETGEAVRLVQEGLVADGIILPISTNKETGELDGIFGQETCRGVQEFQYKYAGDGLLDPSGRADGIIGRNTMGKLDKLARQKKPLPICPDRDQFSGKSVSGPQTDQIFKSPQPSSSFLIIPGVTCQLGQPPGKNKIEPQNPSKPNDLKKYKCTRTKEFRVHIYAHSSHWLKVREQFNTCVDALNPYNIIINIDRLDSISPTTPQTWVDFCELARDAFKAYPPHKDSLPVFVLKLGQQQLGKGNHGRKWTRDECSYLKVYLPKHIEDFVAIDVKTPLGSTMLHEIGHAVLDGSLGNDHDSALKDPENIMFVPGDPAIKRRFLWHNQLRRFCNAQF